MTACHSCFIPPPQLTRLAAAGPLQPLAKALLQLAQAHATYGELTALRSVRTALNNLVQDQPVCRALHVWTC